ncbi:MAG TPA: peptide ligase PGM1-related protein [Anaerolineae bacterium]|nr:peptide ligase PGM1-related protein [Anaerolineae bacterium]
MNQVTTMGIEQSNSADLEAAFDSLQKKLVPLWKFIGAPTQEEHTIVVVPSMTLDTELHGSVQQAYEERFLFMLFLLQQPRVRMIYVTSQAVDPTIIDYYLHILPGVVASHARKRLFLVSPQDASSLPLSKKLLERPRLLEQLRSLIRDPNRAHLVPYNTTDLERELSVRLGIPMYAADPRFFAFGTKSGSRRIFAEEGVPHPLGFENLTSMAELMDAIRQMRAQKPSIQKVIVKLNDEVSGSGNAVIDLQGVQRDAELEARVRAMRFEKSDLTYDEYEHKWEKRGGVVEELISGNEMTSPSAQMRATPLGEVELLSTHDQILGGPSGQTYLGCRFPANVKYGPMIMREAEKIGKRFAREGIVGRFAVDFVVVRKEDGTWDPYAIEVNLRKGGTTHPFLTLQYLTDGKYYPDEGVFRTALGHEKFYVATDHLEAPAYRTLTVDDLFDVVSRNRLHFNHTSQTGVVFHMMSALGDEGRFGMTVIADSHADADALYARTVELMDKEAEGAQG